MALDKGALSELLDALRSGDDIDVVRAGMQLIAQALIELEAAQAIGAGPYERSAELANKGCRHPLRRRSGRGRRGRFQARGGPRRR